MYRSSLHWRCLKTGARTPRLFRRTPPRLAPSPPWTLRCPLCPQQMSTAQVPVLLASCLTNGLSCVPALLPWPASVLCLSCF